jgi:hypothetical protein
MLNVRQIAVLFTVTALSIGTWGWCRSVGPLRPPEEAMRDFTSASNRMESQLTDPLVLAGPDVLPLVLEAVKDPRMRLRRYGIGFLGCSRYKRASGELKRIIADESEPDFIRSDALEALNLVDGKAAFDLARPLAMHRGPLSGLANAIMADEHAVNCRSFFDALSGRDS